MTQESTPLVTDEQIHDRVDEYVLPYRTEITRVVKEYRDIYEADRAALLKERDEAMRLVRQSEGVLIEARVYVDANRDDVRGECITDTWEEDVERSVSNINATLGSISTFISTQTPTE